MTFFLALLIDGMLAGAVYALIALAFVVVYRCTRIINFALGEWVMVSARTVAAGMHALGLGLVASLAAAVLAMAAVALAFARLVLQRMIARPLIAILMATIGLGALLRGGSAMLLSGIPARLELGPFPDSWRIGELAIAPERVLAAVLAMIAVLLVAWALDRSRTGVALRALADDQQAAMAAGIDVGRSFALVWMLMAAICVAAGTLWAMVAGGGFGMALIGLKVFPIVILGGLDSIRGCFVGAIAIGTLESLAAGYLDPLIGGGFGNVCSWLLLIAILFARPSGLFGRPHVARV